MLDVSIDTCGQERLRTLGGFVYSRHVTSVFVEESEGRLWPSDDEQRLQKVDEHLKRYLCTLALRPMTAAFVTELTRPRRGAGDASAERHNMAKHLVGCRRELRCGCHTALQDLLLQKLMEDNDDQRVRFGDAGELPACRESLPRGVSEPGLRRKLLTSSLLGVLPETVRRPLGAFLIFCF